jgi:hypothetical protein
MAGRRYKEVGIDSIFGRYVYEQVVPRGHFLVKLSVSDNLIGTHLREF